MLQEKDMELGRSADDAAAWLTWLEQRADLGPRIIAGHSEGGMIAILLARRHVEGPGEGSWHHGLGIGEVPDPDREPDAMIVGRAPQFALVAGKRLNPDEVLASGNVVLGGDVDIADLIIRTIRAYP